MNNSRSCFLQLSDLEETIKRIQTHKVGWDCGIEGALMAFNQSMIRFKTFSGSDGNNDHQQRRDRGAHHDGHDDDQRLLGSALSPLGRGEISNQGGGDSKQRMLSICPIQQVSILSFDE